jgi:hypothetical protein
MKVTNIKISPPQHAATNEDYEIDLKSMLDPVLARILDRAESAGWDRRKAAYTMMFLAARKVTENRSNSEDEVTS